MEASAMSIIPLHLQRRFERQWAAQFGSRVFPAVPKSEIAGRRITSATERDRAWMTQYFPKSLLYFPKSLLSKDLAHVLSRLQGLDIQWVHQQRRSRQQHRMATQQNT
jgi:hypothetical protein